MFAPIILILGFWTGLVVFTVLATLQTSTESVIFPAATRVIIDEAGAERSAVGTGLLDAAGSMAGGISALIAPILFDATNGPLGSFGMSGTVAVLLLGFAWWNIARRDELRATPPDVNLKT